MGEWRQDRETVEGGRGRVEGVNLSREGRCIGMGGELEELERERWMEEWSERSQERGWEVEG